MIGILKNLFYGVLTTAIIAGLRFIWKKMNEPPEVDKTADPRKIRKQFFVALIFSFVCALAGTAIDDVALSLLAWCGFVFGLLVVWGAFDALYACTNTIKEKISETEPNNCAKK